MDRWTATLDDALATLRTCAPELRDRPIYVRRFSDVVGVFPAGPPCIAATGKMLDLLLQPFVDWRGRGIGIVVADEVPLDDLLPVLAHEIAHALRDRFDPTAFTLPVDRADAGRFIMEMLALDSPNVAPAEIEGSHDAKWHRVALHLRHRLAWQADRVLSVEGIVAYPALSIDARVMHTAFLRDGEYRRCERMPFAEILNQPWPPALAGLNLFHHRRLIQ